MMRQMRENTKWIMLVTALAFVALMVFEWGMDMTGQSAGGVGEIGRVDGSPVFYDAYMNTYRTLYDQVQRNQGETPITSQQNREIEDAAFDEVVNQVLIQQELDRRGIAVTDAELQQAARFNPPPEFYQDPTFQTEGRFDPAKYEAFLASADENFLLSLEAYYRDVIPRGKLLRQVSAGVYVSDAELWRQYRDRNESAQVRYIPLDPATRISDDEIELTEAEIEAYYRDNQDQFEEPARAQVKVTLLNKTPTAADTAASLAEATALLEELESGAGFAELARLESTDAATASAGGDLGVFQRGQSAPAFDSAVFNARAGELVGPVETPFGFHLIEVQERWAQDSARARHILVPIARTDDSEIALLNRADSLENLGEQMALEAAASALELEVETTELTDQFAFVAGAGQVSEGADWAFEEAAIGDVSPVFETPQAFYSLELVSRTPSGVLPLAAARPAIEQTLYFERKQARVADEGQRLVEQIRSGEPLPNVAADAGLQVRGAGPFTRGEFVPGLGRYNEAIGAAFGLDVGEVSDVVATPANSFVVELMDRTPADSLVWIEQKEQQRNQLLQQLQQQRLEAWVAGLRENANIVDRRAQVLQPVDEQPLRQQSPFGF